MAGLICLIGASSIWQTEVKAEEAASGGIVPVVGKLDNASCQTCHDGKKEEIKVPGAEGKMRPLHAISGDKYAKSVHAKMLCVDCHKEITDSTAQHKKDLAKKVGCVQCHQDLWAAAKKENKTQEKPRLGVVVQNIAAYKKSFHARPNQDDPSRVNATCNECHDTHGFNVPVDKKSPQYDAWRKEVPALCGEKCHDEQLETFASSVHGKEVLDKNNAKAPVCTSCHTNHEITNTSLDSFKLLNNEACGSCHKDRLKSYRDTYHGQVTKLGYVDTAKCYNCHGSHGILSAKDPKSKVHPDNRLKTCRECHDGKKKQLATAGFATFAPHANSHDFAKYPQVWISTKFMIALLIGVFAFFWLHSGLWYYREWERSKAGEHRPHVRTADLKLDETKHVRRFGLGWRIAHLVFALTTMTLVLTGTTALFSHTGWAPVVAKALGGAQGLALIHRVAAALFIGIFLIHFVYVMQRLLRDRNFRWFGPDSLVPNWKDLSDMVGMFKWFVGKGDRPTFDRWTYYEKFDYWAVFWGVSVIGGSGLLLAFPYVTATYLPGWIFNVATIVHGEEAFLAAVFLFTVHFFNNHFRPDKLPPPDIVMFTGTQSLEEFRREHPAQYQRLVDAGELDKYLVDAPSRPMALGSKILGLTLITIGLVLLTLVIVGFVGGAVK
ncbi:cytochrome C [Sulfuricella sp. T08]|nr:cytochrome C [Sulfuricella sp. T08]